MSTIIDLSHILNDETPVYPGTVTPSIRPSNTISRDGFREKRILIPSHFGTHIDAPAHILANGKTLDQLPLEHFIGLGMVMDARDLTVIDEATVSGFLRGNPNLEFVVIKTGWEKHWRQATYFEGFPVLSEKAATLLASHGIKGIGVDAISVDSVGSLSLPIHHILLERDLIIVENLCNLAQLPASTFEFQCIPLKIDEADGSPVRAVARV